MKFLHISDLHIGKRVNEFSMIEDQKHILNQILRTVDREGAEAVLIAGDIYDKPVPSAEAVQVFDAFLTALADRKKRVFVVSGNHDSPERIAFGAQLMSGRGVHMSPVYDGEVSGIPLKDEYGELFVYLLPFVKPATVRHALEKQSAGGNGETTEAGSVQGNRDISEKQGYPLPETYQDAVRAAVGRMGIDPGKRNILVAHQFVTGAGRCESEEVLVGGLDNIDAET